jgi:hypothetical protein
MVFHEFTTIALGIISHMKLASCLALFLCQFLFDQYILNAKGKGEVYLFGMLPNKREFWLNELYVTLLHRMMLFYPLYITQGVH